MSLLGLILVLLIVGVILALVPVDPEIRKVVVVLCIVVVVVVLLIILFRLLGIYDLRVPW